MPYRDLREFLQTLEKEGELHRIRVEVDPYLEMTQIMDRVLAQQGPALLFERVKGSSMPAVGNVYGTVRRVALGLDTDEEGLVEIGRFLAYLQQPDPPKGWMEAARQLPFFARVMRFGPREVRHAPCQEVVWMDQEVDLGRFPIQTCWPEDVAPLITWPLVITRSPDGEDHNLGVYRMQVLDRNRTIMRWLPTRGGACHWRQWMARGEPMPVAVALGCDPAVTIAAVTPVPERMGEYTFAGLLRKGPVDVVRGRTVDLLIPATSEIVLEGEIRPGEEAPEGPHGDHTGYYNAVEPFPVFRIRCITHRREPLYLTTMSGRPPKEDAILALALNRIFLPILQKQFPEVVDFHLPMEAVSYRIAIVSIRKQYPGHARRIMMGLWGFLKQFLYIKFIIVVDEDIPVRNWDDVIWALSTRVDPARDVMIIERTPFDYLDFATPVPELGAKMGIDATWKRPPEVDRPWGRVIQMDPRIVRRVEERWREFFPDGPGTGQETSSRASFQ